MRRSCAWVVALLLLSGVLPALAGGATQPLTLEGDVLTGDGASVVRGATVSLLVYNSTGDLVHQDLRVSGLSGNFSFKVPADRWDPGWNASVRASYPLVGAEGTVVRTLGAGTSQRVDVPIEWNRTLGAEVTVDRDHATTPRDGLPSFVVNVTNGGNDTDPVLLWTSSSNGSIQSVFHPTNRTELGPGETDRVSLMLSNPGLLPGDYDVRLWWRSEWYDGEEGFLDLTWTVLPEVDLAMPPSLVDWYPDPLLDGDGALLNCTVVNTGRDAAELANVSVELLHPTKGQVLRDRVRLDVPGKDRVTASFPWKAAFSEQPYTLVFEVEHPLDVSHGDDRVEVQLAVGVNNTPPAVSFSSPPNGTSVNGTVTVVLRAVDPDTPVESVHLRIGGGAWTDLPAGGPRYTWDTETVEDGWYTLEAYATDRYSVGPVTTHVLKVENMGPNHPPEVFIESPLDGDVVGPVLRARGIAFDRDDNVEEVRLRVDDGVWVAAEGTTRWSANLSTEDLDEGAHTLQVIADDGIDISDIASLDFAVTRAAPSALNMRLEASPATVLPGERVEVSGELLYDNGVRADDLDVRIEGPSGLIVFKRSDARGVFSLSTTAPGSEGSYEFSAAATDKAGMAASNTTTLRVLKSMDPDLTVRTIQIEDERVALDRNVTVAVRIENLGFTMGNGTLRAWAGSPGTGDPLEERPITVHTDITVSFVWVPDGTGEVELTVEVVDVLPSDVNLTNNRLSVTVDVVDLPDLTVGAVTLSNPRPYDNSTVSASIRIRNRGGLNASCTVKLYMDAMETDNLVGLRDTDVGAKDYSFVTFEFMVNTGPRVLYVEIVNSYPEESDDENNLATHGFTVGGPFEPVPPESPAPFLPIDPFVFLLILVGAAVATIGGVWALRHS